MYSVIVFLKTAYEKEMKIKNGIVEMFPQEYLPGWYVFLCRIWRSFISDKSLIYTERNTPYKGIENNAFMKFCLFKDG